MNTDFYQSFNQGNAAFAATTPEQFQVYANGVKGIYTANSIDEMGTSVTGAAGGRIAEPECNVFVFQDTIDQAEITDRTVLLVRGKKMRIKTINLAGHNVVMLNCERYDIAVRR